MTSNKLSPDLSGVYWRKSSRSQQQGQCVEVARVDTARAVRDSKDPSGGMLVFGARVWMPFISRIKQGELDVRS